MSRTAYTVQTPIGDALTDMSCVVIAYFQDHDGRYLSPGMPICACPSESQASRIIHALSELNRQEEA